MPLYEYRCSSCGQTVDIKHGFKETVSDPCAACGGPLVRVFSAAGIVFKGSGFYVTDSRKSSGDGASGSGSQAKSSESKSSDSKSSDSKSSESTTSDSKPSESKSESKPSGKSDAAA